MSRPARVSDPAVLSADAARARIAARARDLVRGCDSRDARIAEILERHRALGSDSSV